MSQATGIESAFRVYAPEECGSDGYPLHWHSLPEPEFSDLLNEADLVLPGGIKDVVRALAGHRCVRCMHPFRVRAGRGRWSPCDHGCLHGGPYCAVKLGRVGVGVELSPLYWRDGVEHVEGIAAKRSMPTLFDLTEAAA